jgi:hypothetical protein
LQRSRRCQAAGGAKPTPPAAPALRPRSRPAGLAFSALAQHAVSQSRPPRRAAKGAKTGRDVAASAQRRGEAQRRQGGLAHPQQRVCPLNTRTVSSRSGCCAQFTFAAVSAVRSVRWAGRAVPLAAPGFTCRARFNPIWEFPYTVEGRQVRLAAALRTAGSSWRRSGQLLSHTQYTHRRDTLPPTFAAHPQASMQFTSVAGHLMEIEFAEP